MSPSSPPTTRRRSIRRPPFWRPARRRVQHRLFPLRRPAERWRQLPAVGRQADRPRRAGGLVNAFGAGTGANRRSSIRSTIRRRPGLHRSLGARGRAFGSSLRLDDILRSRSRSTAWSRKRWTAASSPTRPRLTVRPGAADRPRPDRGQHARHHRRRRRRTATASTSCSRPRSSAPRLPMPPRCRRSRLADARLAHQRAGAILV